MTQPGEYRPGGAPPSAAVGAEQVTIASYGSYAEAERAVDHLSDQRFPVERTAIAGRGLSSIERVTGRLTLGRAALQSALSGALLGALFGWLFGLLNWINPLISSVLLAVYGAILGAILGAVSGAVGHALTGGRRDFSSIPGVRADIYEVPAGAAVAEEATRLLQGPGAPGLGRYPGRPS